MEIKGQVLIWHGKIQPQGFQRHGAHWHLKEVLVMAKSCVERKEEGRLSQKLLLVGSPLQSLQRVVVGNTCKECSKVPPTPCFHGEDSTELLCCQALMIKLLFPSHLPHVQLTSLTFQLNHLLFFTPSLCHLSFNLYLDKTDWPEECMQGVCYGHCRWR